MLARLFGDVLRDRVGFGEIFPVRVSADHIAVMLRHPVPEEARRLRPRLIAARHLVDARQADQLGHLRVGVEIGQPVLALHQRIEHAIVVDQPRHLQPARIARPRVHFGIAFVQSAIFAVQHILHLLGRQRGEHALEIAAQPLDDGQRPGIAPAIMHVQQPGEQLVNGIERRP